MTSDLADELDAFLADDDGNYNFEQRDVVQLEDEIQANRLLRRKGRLERKLERIGRQADAEHALIDEWQSRQSRGIFAAIEWVQRSLDAWSRAQHQAQPKLKTFTLPSGVMRLRPTQPRMNVEDREALVAFVVEHDVVPVEYEPKFSTTDVKKKLIVGDRTGELPDADGFVPHCAVLVIERPEKDVDDERIVVPGVTFMVRPELNFTATPTKLAAVTDPGDNADSATPEPQGEHDGEG